MADEKPSGLGSSGIILFVAALASAVYVGRQPPPLVSDRPTEAELRKNPVVATQDIDARLWQDPLAAVMQVAADKRSDQKGGAHTCAELMQPLKEKDADAVLVLGVALPGAPYPEAAETRRRLRYAVLAALHTANYAPEDEKHIGYWKTEEPPPIPNGQQVIDAADGLISIGQATPGGASATEHRLLRDGDPKLPAYIPFEWFREDTGLPGVWMPHQAGNGKRIAVLWLDEDFLIAGHHPKKVLDHLVRMLRSDCNQPRRDVNFALVGPQDSTMLAWMINDIHPQKNPENSVAGRCRPYPSQPQQVEYSIYNFGATADSKRVSGYPSGCKPTIEAHFAGGGIRYFRNVSSDDSLTKLLIQELARRNVGFRARNHYHRDHIALISEWDTVYGRSLHASMLEALGTAADQDVARQPKADSWIESYSYLRGLDGRLPDRRRTENAQTADDKNSEQKETEPASATPENTRKFESAEGQSQFDYLRRIATAIKERDDNLRRSGERIAAVGILGSDVYDKLLILQALRPELSEALFFTTDLDALLLPQEKNRYTRNLLVASSYGLALRPELQADIPPFRNTYQSSIFIATKLALLNEWSDAKICQDVLGPTLDGWRTHPMLFQIGRSAAWALPPGAEEAIPTPLPAEQRNGACSCPKMIGYTTLQPKVTELSPPIGRRSLGGIGFLTAGLLLAGIFASQTMRRHCFPRANQSDGYAAVIQPRLDVLILLVVVAVMVAAVLCLGWPSIAPFLTEDRLGEPMTVFEGISVWPTIAIRAAGFGLTLWLIWYALHDLKKNRENTAQELGYPLNIVKFSEQRRKLNRSQAGTLAVWMAQLWLPPRIPVDSGRPKRPFDEIGGGSSINLPARVIRAAIGTIAMALVWSFILEPIFGAPNEPGRGELARTLYKSVTIADVFATLFLIFVVADATLYARSFIKRLTAVETDWPTTTVARFADKFHMKVENLDDWLDLQIMARRTRCITRLIYFPFLSLAVLIASRSRLFDDFSTPWTLIIAQAISFAVVIGSVLALRAAAEEARSVARDNLTGKIIAAQDDRHTAHRLALMRAEIENLNDGAFAPITSQPIVKAVLLPFLSYGGTWLVHLYALPGA